MSFVPYAKLDKSRSDLDFCGPKKLFRDHFLQDLKKNALAQRKRAVVSVQF